MSPVLYLASMIIDDERLIKRTRMGMKYVEKTLDTYDSIVDEIVIIHSKTKKYCTFPLRENN